MTLAPGTRLGAYEITGFIGAGGMGEVYRARDSRLNRDVAIKILPDAFASDPERLARFKREAHVLASLNNPHIAAIYGFEETSTASALVLELVDGPTLADRIARGPIPLDDALQIAKQVCEALEAAHERGIIHRDLKPANIKLTTDGTVKVLDFGLARAVDGSSVGSDLSASPTITSPAMTLGGVILGTAAYMSPEQAKGKPVDKRSDIWAFGCVLFEMLSGKRAFDGEDISDTLAALLRSDPAWSALPPTTPEAVRKLLRRMLEKDRKRRLADIADARIELEDPIGDPPPIGGAIAVAPTRSVRERLAWLTIIIASVSVLAVAAAIYLDRVPQPPVQKLSLLPPPGLTFSTARYGGLALSPDGRYLVIGGMSEGGDVMLWLRALNSTAARPLPGSEGARWPFWSPDSHSIGFFAQRKLRRVSITGGPAQDLADAPLGYGGTWGASGTIVFAPDQNAALYTVAASGGAVSPVTRFDEATGNRSHRHPAFLPDGSHFLYFDFAGAIRVGSVDSMESRTLVASAGPQFAVTTVHGRSFLLYQRQQTVVAQPFDTRRLALAGEPRPAIEELDVTFTASDSGILAYRPTALGTQLDFVDRSGRRIAPVEADGIYAHLELSPDGKQVVMDHRPSNARLGTTRAGNAAAVYLLDLATRTKARLAQGYSARWGHDGTRILFAVPGGGLHDLNVRTASMSKAVLETPQTFACDVSPDGRFLLYRHVPSETEGGLWFMPLSGGGSPQPVPHTEARGANGRFSPDGKWLAYESMETGREEIYIQPFPPTGVKFPISNEGGRTPRWRGDGRELFFVTLGGMVMAVPIDPTQSFRAGAGVPKPLFQARFFSSLVHQYPYAVTQDGQQFLIITPGEETSAASVSIILNWHEALVPTN
jgi:serine/threonine protein kinase/Tol biopolymer transport system component